MAGCSLYRHYDADGRLLYIGIALSAVARLQQHAKAHWSQSIARVEIKHYESVERARRAEAWAIGMELPLFNIRNRSDLPMSSDEVGRRIRFTLADAYRLAAKGERFNTFNPIEFATMPEHERRHHRRMMKRIARLSRRS
jgi:excinuclease UvrABC nuclease subunit